MTMTLVVARCENGRIAIAADTLLTDKGVSLPLSASSLKIHCLPGYLCVAYSGSSDLAARVFLTFKQEYPLGTGYDNVVTFFEDASSNTGNDFILAFGTSPRLVTVRDGKREASLAKTHWIGDKKAYETFRELEHRQRYRYEHRRAVNAAIFADEMAGSPAGDLHGVMRNIVLNPEVPTVGGFVTVISNRDIGFRYSAYSDVLLDWPGQLAESQDLQLTDKINLTSSGENDRFSISQISAGYYNMNSVAFYLLKGKLLIVFLACTSGQSGRCLTFPGVEPANIAATLNEKLGFDYRAMCLVMSSREEISLPDQRTSADHGLGLSLYCEANTFPSADTSGLPP